MKLKIFTPTISPLSAVETETSIATLSKPLQIKTDTGVGIGGVTFSRKGKSGN